MAPVARESTRVVAVEPAIDVRGVSVAAATTPPAIPDVVMYVELAPGADGLAALVPAVPPSREAVRAEIAAGERPRAAVSAPTV